jgi:tellurite resistance protein TerC
MDQSILQLHPGLIWGFGITIILMLLLDLGIFNKKSHVVSNKEAVIWTVVWISLAMLFSGFIFFVFNQDIGGYNIAIEKFTQFQAAYWIEKALSVDNLFVFILVFGYFKVPKELHHKVLFWGIIGALIFRALFIFAGVGLINVTYLDDLIYGNFSVYLKLVLNIIFVITLILGLILLRYISIVGKIFIVFSFSFLILLNLHQLIETDKWNLPHINIVMTLFGLFLVYAGIKSWGSGDDDDDQDFKNSAGARLVKKLYKVSDSYDKDNFFTIQNGVKLATPLLLVVAVIEFTDVLFAVDSIPAIFAISKDPFILYTSNIFAILGLRSLYFLLSNFIHMFSKLPYGLAIILSFIGVKMIISPWYHISSPISLGIVGGILLISVILSVMFPDKKA